jgi:anti-sigma-K factor RskA
MTEEHISDTLPAYALGILEEADLLKVARHLSHCRVCARDLETYQAVVDSLAMVTPLHNPAPDLKAGVIRRVEAAARRAPPANRGLAPADPGKSGTRWLDLLSGLWGSPTGLALVVLAFLLVLFLGTNNFLLWQRINELEARVPGNDVQIIRLDGSASAPQAVAYMIVFDNNHYGSLTVENAPVLREDQQYQVWLVRDGEQTSGGVFSVSDTGYGVLQVYSKQPLEVYDAFGVTIEPAGGSPAPTGEKILSEEL